MMLWIYARLPTRTTDIKFNPINHIDMKTKLSPYTIASNCTDLTDIRDGINEIQDEMKRLVSEGKKKDLGFLLNRAIDYLDEIGLTPAEKYKAEISDTLQRMIEKEKE